MVANPPVVMEVLVNQPEAMVETPVVPRPADTAEALVVHPLVDMAAVPVVHPDTVVKTRASEAHRAAQATVVALVVPVVMEAVPAEADPEAAKANERAFCPQSLAAINRSPTS